MTTTTSPQCDLPCCTEAWAPFEKMLCAVQVFCPHNHGDVLATVFRVEESTTKGTDVVSYVGTERERATTFTQYGVTAHVLTDTDHRWATREEIESGEAHGYLAAGDRPHVKYVARCPRPSCNYRLQWSRPFDVGNLDKVSRRIEKLLDYYGHAQPGCTVRVTDIETDRDTQVSSVALECHMRVH